ncbi:NPCBM/NEW2 domain-containing protein [Streptomyces sp. A3M-1-3]|nr:NPCBM/NEW2 domain-containing protein [Streptomyces sp. A3M-1-3]MCP3816768.1 NPCBM/NEW2 domain-containing protein [Streptomyces sp. A3M-1-3]
MSSRAACALAAASSAVFALAGPTLPASAAVAEDATAVIGSPQLAVTVAKDFPRVLTYTDRASGSQLAGSTAPVTAVVLNGKAYGVQVKGEPVVGGSSAHYTLALPDLTGVELDAALSVSGRTTTFRVTAVRDTDAFRVGTIDIPGHDLVSVGSTDTGAGTAFTKLDPDSTRTADVIGKVTTATPADAAPVGATYAIVNTGTLAAAASGRATLRIEAEPRGSSPATVRIDDIRVVANAPEAKAGTVVHEDFEAVDQGWGPFLKGDAGGSTDPRTHIAQKNAPYTQAGWNGKLVDDVLGGAESLKAHEENTGLVYRTAPWTVPMADGHAYKVEFDHQSSHAGAYEWVTGYDRIAADGTPASVETRRTPIGKEHATDRFSETVTAGCGDTWTGLRKKGGAPDGADFVLDGFTVTDLGPAPERAACGTLTVDPSAETLEPGRPNLVKASFTNYEAAAATGAALTLALPEGWQSEPAGAVTFDSVAPGAKVTGSWQVTPPVDAKYQSYTLSSQVAYTVGGTERKLAAAATVRTLPPPPTTDSWASDLDWTSAANGWGPVERDLSNGEQGQGDGKPMKIGGVAYEKGLGTHGPAAVRYYLGGRCTSFTAEVGVDDVQATRGSVQFSVQADGTEKVKSPVLRAADSAWSLTADVTGATYVDLVAGDGGDGNGNDHADWGSARFHCGS